MRRFLLKTNSWFFSPLMMPRIMMRICMLSFLYTADEYAQMSRKINGEFTYDDLLEIIASYSVEDVMTRHNAG